jgi:hypothetical protein
MKYQNRYIFSDTETTGVSERDFIQIIQSASMLTDDDCRTLDVMNVSCAPLPWTVPTPGAYLTHKKIDTSAKFRNSLPNDEIYSREVANMESA